MCEGKSGVESHDNVTLTQRTCTNTSLCKFTVVCPISPLIPSLLSVSHYYWVSQNDGFPRLFTPFTTLTCSSLPKTIRCLYCVLLGLLPPLLPPLSSLSWRPHLVSSTLNHILFFPRTDRVGTISRQCCTPLHDRYLRCTSVLSDVFSTDGRTPVLSVFVYNDTWNREPVVYEETVIPVPRQDIHGKRKCSSVSGVEKDGAEGICLSP